MELARERRTVLLLALAREPRTERGMEREKERRVALT
jgi:hypothetical protein